MIRPRQRPDFFPPRPRAGLATGAALLGAALLAIPASGAAQAQSLRFCVDKANPMLAIDLQVAKAVAQAAGRPAQIVTRDSSRDATDDDDDLSGHAQMKLLHGLTQQCDVIMDFPVLPDDSNLPPGMAASRPYARTGFVAAGPGVVAGDFRSLLAQGRVGVLEMTPAATYFDASTMDHEHLYPTNEQLYGALLNGEVKTALIWQPWLNQQLAAHPQPIHVAELNMPYAQWNVVALYPQSAQNTPAVQAFNTAIASLAAKQELGGIVKPYDVPETEK